MRVDPYNEFTSGAIAMLLTLRGDLDAPDVPKPMRAVGLICVVWLSWVTSPVIRVWQRVRSSRRVSE